METNTEYQYQRDGVTLWLGVALGLGIEVDAHMGIFDNPLYGYEGEVVIDYHQFDARIAELTPQIDEISKQYLASVATLKKVIDRFAADASADNDRELLQAVHAQLAIGEQLGTLDGMRQENMKYKSKADAMKSVSGEFLFSRQEFESSAKQLTDKVNETNTIWITYGTRLGDMHEAIKRAAKNSPKRGKLVQQYRQTLQGYMNASNKMAVYRGAAQENFNYMAYLDKHIRAAGGAKSEQALLESMRNSERLVEA